MHCATQQVFAFHDLDAAMLPSPHLGRLMACSAALSSAVTVGLMLSGCVSASRSRLWLNAPIFVGPAIFAAWKMVIALNQKD